MGVDPYIPRTHRFSEVKEHNGYHAVRKAREAEKAMEAAA